LSGLSIRAIFPFTSKYFLTGKFSLSYSSRGKKQSFINIGGISLARELGGAPVFSLTEL
jgi:hypothetical protein